MKKRILSLLAVATLIFTVVISFASCGNNSFFSSGFTVSEATAPSLDYNGQDNTTSVTLYVRVTNQTRVTVESLSFFAEFRDSSGKILDSSVCQFDIPLASGESKNISYSFNSGDAVEGRVASVTYSPCEMRVVGGSDASEVATGEASLGVFGIILIVLGIILCLTFIFIAIVCIYSGVEDPYDEGGYLIGIGIIIIIAAVIFGITIIVLA